MAHTTDTSVIPTTLPGDSSTEANVCTKNTTKITKVKANGGQDASIEDVILDDNEDIIYTKTKEAGAQVSSKDAGVGLEKKQQSVDGDERSGGGGGGEGGAPPKRVAFGGTSSKDSSSSYALPAGNVYCFKLS